MLFVYILCKSAHTRYMPAEKHSHPVKIVRKITGKTQREMAKILDTTRSRLAQIEAGILPMPAAMVRAVFAETGAIVAEGYGLPDELPEYVNIESEGGDGTFTEDSYLEWKYLKKDNSDETREQLTQELMRVVEAALIAAAKAGNLRALATELLNNVIVLAKDFASIESLKSTLKELELKESDEQPEDQ